MYELNFRQHNARGLPDIKIISESGTRNHHESIIQESIKRKLEWINSDVMTLPVTIVRIK